MANPLPPMHEGVQAVAALTAPAPASPLAAPAHLLRSFVPTTARASCASQQIGQGELRALGGGPSRVHAAYATKLPAPLCRTKLVPGCSTACTVSLRAGSTATSIAVLLTGSLGSQGTFQKPCVAEAVEQPLVFYPTSETLGVTEQLLCILAAGKGQLDCLLVEPRANHCEAP